MSSMASTAGGVFLARAADRAIFGSGGGAAEAADAPEAAGGYDAGFDGGFAQEAQGGASSVCVREVEEFRKCLERSGSDMGACQWNLDLFTECQRKQAELSASTGGGF